MLFGWTNIWEEGQMETSPKKGNSHTLAMINMIVQERSSELESSGDWSGQEYVCVRGSEVEKCFMKGQPIGSVKSYHDARQWLQSLGYFHPIKLLRGLPCPKDLRLWWHKYLCRCMERDQVNCLSSSSLSFLLNHIGDSFLTLSISHDFWKQYCDYQSGTRTGKLGWLLCTVSSPLEILLLDANNVFFSHKMEIWGIMDDTIHGKSWT